MGNNNQGNQYLRKASVLIGNSSEVLDLSNLECEFRTVQADFVAPSHAYIRIFNPNPTTINSVQTEGVQVVLQAGYENGNFGQIFAGTVMQTKTGKLDNVTRYLDIMASDGDSWYSYGFINQTLAAGASPKDQLAAIKKALAAHNITVDPNAETAIANAGGVLPRGKTLSGIGTIYLNNLADLAGCTWYIESGVLKIVPLTGYLPGTAVVINSQTGMVGSPEATQQGIEVRCLLNPLLKIGNTVKLNNNEITKTEVKNQGFPNYSNISLFPTINTDGLYRVVVAEHFGGTRTNAWYSDIVCLSIDQSIKKVQPYG